MRVVRRHIDHLYRRLSVGSRAGLIVRIVREHMEILFAGGPPTSCPLHKRLEASRRLHALPPERSAECCPFLCDWAWQTIAASFGLSDREVDICRCFMRELQGKEIALDRNMARRTVDRHIDRLYRKLCLHTREGVVAWILHEHIETLHSPGHGIITPPPACCGLRSPLTKI